MKIEGELANANSLMEVVKDSCEHNQYMDQEFVIKIALRKYYNVMEKLSDLYI